MAGAIHTGALAGKPAAFFVVPDPYQQVVASVTEQAGAYPGPVSGGQYGHLAPSQSGDSVASGVNGDGYEYAIARAGGNQNAEFCWRRSGNVANSYFGKDDPRHQWGHHPPISNTTPGSDNNASCYHSASRNLIVFGCAGTVGYIYLRNVDTDRYDLWTNAYTFTLRSSSSANHGASLMELPDGTIMLVVRTSANNDFDVYHASDPTQDSWILVSRGILARFNPTGVIAQQSAGQQRLARAGEWIRLVFPDNVTAGLLHTVISRDRGMTWQYIGTGPTVRDTATTDDRIPFDLCGVDDAGTFLLGAVNTVTLTTAVFYTATGTGAWVATTSHAGSLVQIREVVLARGPSFVYCWLLYNDGVTTATDGWDFGRAPLARYSDITNVTGDGWQWLPAHAMNPWSGCENYPGRVSATWAGPGWFFYGTVRSELTGTELSTGCAWYSDSWTDRSLGDTGPTQSLATLASELWNVSWNCGHTRPSDGAGTGWTVTTVATGIDVATPSFIAMTGAAAGDQRYYEHAAGGAAGVWHDTGGTVRWMMRLDTGDSTTAADNVAVRIIMANAAGTARRDVSIRISGPSVTVQDNVAVALRATLSSLAIDSGSTGAFHEFRFTWGANGTLARLMVYNTSTKVWSTTATFSLTSAAAAATSLSRWGHLGQVQATQMASWWREYQWTNDGTQLNMQSTSTFPATSTQEVADYMFGAVCAAAPHFVEYGLYVGWGGVGAGEQDSFVGELSYSYPKEAIFVDSPRVAWRSTSLAAQTFIMQQVSSGFRRTRHNACAVFNCNNRFVLIDYDSTSAFASPTATETIDLTAFDTGTTPLVVSSVDGNTVVLTGTTFQFTAGELVGYYVRATSGAASGKTWKVTRHPYDGTLQFDDLTNNLATVGLAATNTVIIFASHGVKRYASTPSEAFMRIRLSDTDTAEGYHMLGTVVCGTALDVTVPMDWSHTDDEQPNVTQYRTRGGVSWAYQEGPSQRTVVGRVIGDRERWRDRFRHVLRAVGYEAKAMAFVMDSLRATETLMLGRVTSGSSLDNAAWYVDSAGKARTAGDLSLTITEEAG